MPLVFHYLAWSPPVRSVDLTVHALGLEDVKYEIVDLFKSQHLSPKFLEINPAHTIPVIEDDGFFVWESRAIMPYLVSKFGKDDALYPKDLKKRAIVDQRLHFTNEMFLYMKKIAKSLLFLNATSIPEDVRALLKDGQESLERLLKGGDFLAGDKLTIADFSLITFIDIVQKLSPPGGKFPLTQKWIARCAATIKDFDKVNKEGAVQFIDLIKDKLTQ